MKKLFFTVMMLVLAAGLILNLSGCGPVTANSTPPLTEDQNTAAAPPPTTSPPAPSASTGSGQQPRPLTEAEKAKVVEIAVNSPEARQWLKGRTDYRIRSVDWYAISFQDGKAGAWSIVSPGSTDSGLPSPYLSEPVSYYPGVTIAVGEDTIYQMQIAVDLDTGKIVMSDGPYVSLDSPGRLRDLSPKPPTVTPTVSPENPVIMTIPVNQNVTVNGITLTLEQIVITDTGFNINVLYTPPGFDPAAGMPSSIPGATAGYSLDGGPIRELVSPPPFSFSDKGIEWCWIADGAVPEGAAELTVRITSVGTQTGLWEFKVPLN